MANYFTAILGSGISPDLRLVPFNKGSKIYFNISGVENYTLVPSEKVKALVCPHSTPLSSGLAKNLLRSSNFNNISHSGYFFFDGGENNTQQDDKLSFSDLEIPRGYENTEFDLYLLRTLGTSEYYATYTGVYSYPHNAQPEDITISGNLNGNNSMTYTVYMSSLNNDNDSNYGSSPSDGPYGLKVEYKNNDGTNVSGFSDYLYYDETADLSGISLTLPFYDSRDSYKKIPAVYNFKLVYNSASDDKPGSTPLNVTIDHAELIDSSKYYKNLDEYVFTNPDPKKIKKVGEVEIPPYTIDRKRLSIGISDISINTHSYVKKGVYVSPYYPMDTDAYTLSLKVDEYIPHYDNISPTDIIKYYIEFNNNAWERISPINREQEYYNNKIIPKMFILDSFIEDIQSDYIKFLNYGSIKVFRVKITFDLSNIPGSTFSPPEIRDYKCLVYDKNQLTNI